MLRFLAKKLYHFATDEKRVNIFRKFDKFLRIIGGKAYIRTLGQAKYHLRYDSIINNNESIPSISNLWDAEKPVQHDQPLVSVLAPYDPEKMTEAEAIQIIRQQTYSRIEIKAIPQISSDYFVNCLKHEITATQGQLIWICKPELCDNHTFLERMVSLFIYESVMVGIYDNTASTVKEDRTHFVTASFFAREWLHNQGTAYSFENIVFKKPVHDIPDSPYPLQKYCALLWILYFARGGTIGLYHTDAFSVSSNQSVLSSEQEADERKSLLRFIAENYKLDHNTSGNMGRGFQAIHRTSPNVIMACYALKSGGGETYPIYLANELKRRGITVTILNFDLEEREESVVRLIDRDIPIINLRHTDDIGTVLQSIGADIIHSHHATVDYSLALWLEKYPELGRHIITLHGMYEAIEEADCTRVINATSKSVYRYVYIADKNLDSFKKRGRYEKNRFIKMANGLPQQIVKPVSRTSLEIGQADFVLVLASRGIREKGWKEAIQAVIQANSQSSRPIHLVILGDGEIRRKLERNAPSYIHFTGTVSNVRDYFAMGDAGILPSRYKGESYPIAIMECLSVGKPVIATNIAEVPNQITDADGNKAGLLIELDHWKFRVNDLCKAILCMVNDPELYEQLKGNAFAASRKFDMKEITSQYIRLYQEACNIKPDTTNERSME